MEKYLSNWMRIIEEMHNDNTYKTAWGRGIIECISIGEYSVIEDKGIVKQSDIVNKMIKYYWNQTFFFGLTQGKSPVILKHINSMIDKYKTEVSTYPVPWNDVEQYFMEENVTFYNKRVSAILSNIRINVCPRFKNVSNSEILDIYDIKDKEKLLIFQLKDIGILEDYGIILSKLLNYKWSQLLERFNTSPNITKKVKAASDRKIRRSSLAKYKNLLLKYYHNQEIRDFYSGEIIDKKDIHIDHVIPWSFIYSDDIWNLVVTSSTNNLSKSNRPPTKTEIEKLELRNKELLKSLSGYETGFKKSIEYSLEHKTLNKLYVNMKG